jgi:hypothetical protein
MKIATSELEHLREEVKNCHRIIKDLQKKREFVGLTDEELSEVYNQADWDTVNGWEYERAIEAKLKEKNESHRQHVTDGNPCWCDPETSYTDPETGASVIVHKEPQ